jgi:hypothetical protein
LATISRSADGQAYALRLTQGNRPVAAGVFDNPDSQLAVAADKAQYQAVAITVEKGPLGSPTPQGEKVIVTPL